MRVSVRDRLAPARAPPIEESPGPSMRSLREPIRALVGSSRMNDRPQDSSPDAIAITAFGIAVLIGGVNYVAVRFSNRELDPFWGAGGRFVVTAILFLLLVAVMRLRMPRGRQALGAIAYGVFGIAGFYGFIYWGLQEVTAGVASVIAALAPLLTMLLSIAQRLETYRSSTLVGALVGAAGTAVMFLQPSEVAADPLRLLAVLAATTCVAQSVVIAKRNPDTHPMVMNGVGMLAGGALLLLVSLAANETWRLPDESSTRLAIVYLILGSVVLFRMIFVVVRRWTASATSFMFVLFPIVAIAAGALIADEPVTVSTVIGGLLVITAVYVGALRRTIDERRA